jgi:hypothetical protein
MNAVSRSISSIVALLLVSTSLGCHTRAKSMAAICELPRACPECLEALEAGDPSRYQDYLRTNAPHPDMGRMFQELARAPAGQRVQVVRRWAATEGIEDCAFADWLARPVVVYPR